MSIEKQEKPTILLLSWRDIKHFKAGGAEIFTHQMITAAKGTKNYHWIHFSCWHEGLAQEEWIDGVHYIRHGLGPWTVIQAARSFYQEHAEDIMFVIDQCNTHRFFTTFWVPLSKRIFFIHQLTREIWFVHLPLPWNALGYFFEKIFLRWQRHDRTLTVSESTKNDLLSLGFHPERIALLPEGLSFKAWSKKELFPKEDRLTLLYVGRYAHYKGIDDAIKAVGILKSQGEEARLWIVGARDEDYLKKRLEPMSSFYGLSSQSLAHREALEILENKSSQEKWMDSLDLIYWGFLPEDAKHQLMSRAWILLYPSMREGWGLTVTEAAAVGTVSIVYPSSGLVDAVEKGLSGFITEKRTAESLAQEIIKVIKNPQEMEKRRQKAWNLAKTLSWEKTSQSFLDVLLQWEKELKK